MEGEYIEMTFYVDCRTKDKFGRDNITIFDGWAGLPLKIARDIFKRESSNNMWQVVYLCKVLKNGHDDVIKIWNSGDMHD